MELTKLFFVNSGLYRQRGLDFSPHDPQLSHTVMLFFSDDHL